MKIIIWMLLFASGVFASPFEYDDDDKKEEVYAERISVNEYLKTQKWVKSYQIAVKYVNAEKMQYTTFSKLSQLMSFLKTKDIMNDPHVQQLRIIVKRSKGTYTDSRTIIYNESLKEK